MIDAIRASFKKGLPDLEWMDDKTRRAAEDKVSSDLNKILAFANNKLFIKGKIGGVTPLCSFFGLKIDSLEHLLCSCSYGK